ncbi:MAG: hypothetical protein NZ700_13270 [Gemmataceae bacterium]|nr:hypothetical protein [Gemmataceae bacterium]MDW8266920.1 hypothetical protein [Gemmataceae bacterium]
MRFALLGDHPDGLDLAQALTATGRYTLHTYAGPPAGAAELRQRGLTFSLVPDVEEVLADPTMEAVIVASAPAVRAQQLRRAAQSEHHVFCVHPADDTPDIAYEAGMIQKDTRKVLLPVLPATGHPAVGRLQECLGPRGRLGPLRLVCVERVLPSFAEGADDIGRKAWFPGWDVLEVLGGTIVEVSAFAAGTIVAADEPTLLAGRFEKGGVFQVTLLPVASRGRLSLRLWAERGEAELSCVAGWSGPVRLVARGLEGEEQVEEWGSWDPWPAFIARFEALCAAPEEAKANAWQEAIRCLELDDAARRSLERRRVSPLEYPEADEDVGFKGTMTLIGCGLLWGLLALFVLSAWLPWAGWLVLPLLAVFLLLQLLRWLIPRRPSGGE